MPRGHSVFSADFLPTFNGSAVVCGVKTVLVGCSDGIMSRHNNKKKQQQRFPQTQKYKSDMLKAGGKLQGISAVVVS